MRSYAAFLCLCLFTAGRVFAFTVPQSTIGSGRTAGDASGFSGKSNEFVLKMAPKDPSRSGTKTDRMDRLAEMEKLGSVDQDNSVFIKAAGGFAALIVIAIAAAGASGLLTQY
mmetsp:Transcript_22375/g.53238  ORF Transcript_22375/g.53238 Transcript_22375/m.53238 type:complete len:113 (-) Transcript_22375:127-465(-)